MNTFIRLILYCILWMQYSEAFVASQFASFVTPPPMKLLAQFPMINSFETSSTSLRYTNLDVHEPSCVLHDPSPSSRAQKTDGSNGNLQNSSDLQLENLPRIYYTQTKQRLNKEFLMNIEMTFGRLAIIGLVVMILHQVISQFPVIH